LSSLLFSCSDEGSSNSQVGEGGTAANSEGTNVEGGTYIDGEEGTVTTGDSEETNGEDATVESDGDDIVNSGNGSDVGNDSGSVEGGTYNGEDATVEE
jgi:hypothetical protein